MCENVLVHFWHYFEYVSRFLKGDVPQCFNPLCYAIQTKCDYVTDKYVGL